MKEYPLYLESGPMHRRTMAHVLSLPGCVVGAPTTDEAIAAAPDAIRSYLRLLQRHGEAVDPGANFATPVALHVVERGYIGYGDPIGGFPPDFEPIDSADIELFSQRHRWIHEDMGNLVRHADVSLEALLPDDKWPIRRLLEHVAETEYEYLRCSLGHIDGLRKEVRTVAAQGDPLAALELQRPAIADRITNATPDELAARVQRGAKIWTVARTCRRILEHRWEHYQQLAAALESRPY